MRKGALPLLMAGMGIALFANSTQAMADYFAYVRVYMKHVDMSAPLSATSVTERPPTVEGTLEFGRYCSLNILGKSYKVRDCYMRYDNRLGADDDLAFVIQESDLIDLAHRVNLKASKYNAPELTALVDGALKRAGTGLSACGREIEISNVSNSMEKPNESIALGRGATASGANGFVVVTFEMEKLRERSRATR